MRCFNIPRRKGTKLFAHLQILSNFESRILNYEVEKGKVQGKYWMVIIRFILHNTLTLSHYNIKKRVETTKIALKVSLSAIFFCVCAFFVVPLSAILADYTPLNDQTWIL